MVSAYRPESILHLKNIKPLLMGGIIAGRDLKERQALGAYALHLLVYREDL